MYLCWPFILPVSTNNSICQEKVVSLHCRWGVRNGTQGGATAW